MMDKETPMKKRELSNNQKINYKNVIRNMHFEDILEKTTSGFNNIPSYLKVVKEFFNDYIIDYKLHYKECIRIYNKRKIWILPVCYLLFIKSVLLL